VLRDCRNLITGISLYDENGVCLFANCDWRPNQLTNGLYMKSAHIPGQLMAEGRFSILTQLVFHEPDIKSVIQPDSLLFTTVDSDHPNSIRGSYKEPWPGQLRVGLDWSDANRNARIV
jgi:hypothetical protein